MSLLCFGYPEENKSTGIIPLVSLELCSWQLRPNSSLWIEQALKALWPDNLLTQLPLQAVSSYWKSAASLRRCLDSQLFSKSGSSLLFCLLHFFVSILLPECKWSWIVLSFIFLTSRVHLPKDTNVKHEAWNKHMAKRKMHALGNLIPFAGQANGYLTI